MERRQKKALEVNWKFHTAPLRPSLQMLAQHAFGRFPLRRTLDLLDDVDRLLRYDCSMGRPSFRLYTDRVTHCQFITTPDSHLGAPPPTMVRLVSRHCGFAPGNKLKLSEPKCMCAISLKSLIFHRCSAMAAADFTWPFTHCGGAGQEIAYTKTS
jgi:hypothetical protein